MDKSLDASACLAERGKTTPDPAKHARRRSG